MGILYMLAGKERTIVFNFEKIHPFNYSYKIAKNKNRAYYVIKRKIISSLKILIKLHNVLKNCVRVYIFFKGKAIVQDYLKTVL